MPSPSPAIRIEATCLTETHHARALLDMLEHYARDPMGGGTPLSDQTRHTLIDALKQRRDFVSFLAFDGPRPVGLVNCFEGFSTFAAQPLLNIHDIAVHADYRGRGIGRQLLTAAEQAARARGCCKLTLEVLSNNHPAMQAYVHAGFAPYALDPAAGHALFMQKWLDTPPGT